MAGNTEDNKNRGSTSSAAAGVPLKRYGPRPSLTERQKQELNIAFGEFDPRGMGLIDSRNFVISLRAMGFEPKVPHAKAFIEEVIGPRGEKVLDFKDYYELMSRKMIGDDSKADVVKMFKMFCGEETGVITWDDLSKIAVELGEDISPDELQEMISFAHTSQSGKGVTLDEFIKMMERPQLE